MPKNSPRSHHVRLKACGYGVDTETGKDRFFLVIVDGGRETAYDFGPTDASRITGTLDQYFGWRNDPDREKE